MATTDGDPRWRQRVADRSLRSARARAVTRSDRFIDAATELLSETGRIDFTVQEIVERSQMSLRAFYQHFGSKDELLLALFEEVIRSFITRLRADVERYDDPVARMEAVVTGLFSNVEGSASPSTRALTLYHLRLAESHPNEFAHALAPQVELVLEIIEAGVAGGQFRQDIEPRQLAMIVMQCLVSALQMNVLGIHMTGVEVAAADLCGFCLSGLRPPPSRRPLRRGSRPLGR
jgi:AcrR family transcriptional regulator